MREMVIATGADMTPEGIRVAVMAAVTAVAIVAAITCAVVFVLWMIDEPGP